MVKIIKKSGKQEEFSAAKVRDSLRRAGAPKKIRDEILQKLTPRVKSGMTTTEIYRLVYDWLREERNYLAASYNLKQAIMALGPTGYPFETFLAGVLAALGYQTARERQVKGECVDHEVDIIALTQNKDLFSDRAQPTSYMVECKFHNRGGIKTAVKDALYIYARFLDVKKTKWSLGGKEHKFDFALLATNTKLTSEAKKYCRCRGMKMLSWDQPEGASLPKIVSGCDLHPLTCLSSLSDHEKQNLLKKNIVFCRDLLQADDWRYLVADNKQGKIVSEVRNLIALTYEE